MLENTKFSEMKIQQNSHDFAAGQGSLTPSTLRVVVTQNDDF